MKDPSHAGAVVWVVGDMTRVAGVNQHLPNAWSLRPAPNANSAADHDLVLLVCPTVDDVAAIDRHLAKRSQLVVLLDTSASPTAVAAVLEAGADMCVTSNSGAILASHLIACRRRLTQQADQRKIDPTGI